MSWHFSQALVEEFSRANCSDGEPCAPWKSTPSAADDSCSAKMKATCHLSPFGMMFVPLTDARGEELLTWFRAAFLAKIFLLSGEEKDYPANEADFGPNLPESLVKYDLSSHSWKIRPSLESADWIAYLPILPAWGTMQNGSCWGQKIVEFRKNVRGCGYWPTPTAAQNKNRSATIKPSSRNGTHGWSLKEAVLDAESPCPVRQWPNSPAPCRKNHQHSIYYNATPLNPEWVEWLMAWPLGWTDLQLLETDKFRLWLRQHGVFYPDESPVDYLSDL